MTITKILTYGIKEDATDVRGKFLQLRFAGHEYLLFAPKELHGFHNHILAHFLEDRELAHYWEDEHTLKVDAHGIEIVGGGKFVLDTAARKLDLFDNSQAYGRFDERGLGERLAAAGHPWSEFKIGIS